MKATLAFPAERCECGPATPAVRQIFAEWAAIDWFVPARASAAAASELFGAHEALARKHHPDLFPERVELEFATGGWAELEQLCARVRTQSIGWDWKFSALKPLSCEHSRARGWKLEDQPRRPDGIPQPGDLFVGYGTTILWNDIAPKLDLRGVPHAESVAFYVTYANMDVYECLEWQLAERSDDLAGNPFVPLLRCYAAGFYPFCIGKEELVMFSFAS